MAFYHTFLLLCLSLVFASFAPSYAQVLTNSASYLTSRVLSFNNSFIVGSVTTATFDPLTQTALLGTSNTLIRLDLNTNSLNNANSTFRIFQQDVLADLIGPQIDPSSRLILVAGRAPPPSVALLYLDNLTLVDVGFNVGNQNPVRVSALQDILGSVRDSQYAYFASRTYPGYIGRISFQNFTNGVQYLITNISLASITRDSSRGFIYCGSADGRVLRITVNDTDFASSTLTVISTSVNASLTQIQIDTIRNLIYVATQGTGQNNQAVVIRINGTTFTESGRLDLFPLDFSISSSAIVDTPAGGLLYFGTRQIPGRLIQISLPDFREEIAFFVNGLGRFDSAFIDNDRTQLYFGSIDTATQSPALHQFRGADPCLGMCFGHGVCTYRQCTCGVAVVNNVTLPWLLPWCEFLDCQFPNCSGHGVCLNGTCNCDSVWTGVACEIRQCPNNCTSPDRGVCIYSNGVPVACQCAPGWEGIDCSVAQPTPCPLRQNCSDCLANPRCGWCESSQKCVDGDIIGPFDGTGCRQYHYTECPNLGIPILNYIFTAFLGLMLLVNIITFIAHESSSERPGKRLEWYRFQRSEKAWSYIFQLQFLASISLLGFAYPTFFVQFSVYWSWALLAFGMPWLDGPRVSPPPPPSSRVLLNFDQYLTYAFNPAQLALIQFLIWWGVITGAIIVGVIFTALIAACRGRENVGGLFVRRIIYGLLRSIDLAYFGLVIFSAIQLVKASVNPGFAALGAILLFLVGIVYPILIELIVIKVDRHTLFDDNFKDKFFPAYGLIKFQTIRWTFLPFAKKFFIAIAIGFFIDYYPAQLAIIAFILILYIISLIVVKPYADYLHAYLEFIVSVLTLLSLPFLFAFLTLNLSSSAKLAMSIIFIIFNYLALVTCFTFYMISWFHMREVFSWRQFKKFVGRKK